MKFEIAGRFPGLNEIIAAAKSSPYAYSKMHEQYTDIVAWTAKMLPRFEGTVDITVMWHEKNAKRDIDNIASGFKFIGDGLVKAGIIRDDSQKYVKSITHRFEVDAEHPRIEVEVIPCCEGQKGV
jgi:Holliday junction resolvase RusA-like endonuclease